MMPIDALDTKFTRLFGVLVAVVGVAIVRYGKTHESEEYKLGMTGRPTLSNGVCIAAGVIMIILGVVLFSLRFWIN